LVRFEGYAISQGRDGKDNLRLYEAIQNLTPPRGAFGRESGSGRFFQPDGANPSTTRDWEKTGVMSDSDGSRWSGQNQRINYRSQPALVPLAVAVVCTSMYICTMLIH
jgi:hypothetical protein